MTETKKEIPTTDRPPHGVTVKRLVMPLTFDDFSPINFGILTAKSEGYEFIFQRPMSGDSKRAAQKGCVLFINHKQQPVEEIEHALRIINDFIGAA